MQAEKGIAWHIDVSSIVWSPIDHSKLASQIARLVAIVVKLNIDWTVWWETFTNFNFFWR